MAESSLHGLYTICVQRFNNIQLDQAWSTDHKVYLMKFCRQQARFACWGQVLGLHEADHHKSIFGTPDVQFPAVQVLNYVVSCLEEIKTALGKHGLPLEGCKDSLILAHRFLDEGSFRKSLRRLWDRLKCFHFERRQKPGVIRVTVNPKTIPVLIEEFRELVDYLILTTESLEKPELQPLVDVRWDTNPRSDATGVKLDQPSSRISYRILPPSKEVFATIVEKNGRTRRAVLQKLKKGKIHAGGKSDSTKRIITELSQVAEYDELQESFSLAPFEGDIFNCLGAIYGPQGTPYEGGIFYLWIMFPPSYPFNPPRIRFLTRILHPNITPDGRLCLDVLREKWSPALTISHMLLSICSFLDDPTPEQSLVKQASRRYMTNRAAYEDDVRMCVKRYATGNLPSLVELRHEPQGDLARSPTTIDWNHIYNEDSSTQEKRFLGIPF
ncbi:hypothetical protein MMC34_005755 [Xylographa carneopallida]|nr:hypothetical protein [Xylographa carneopallida]